MFNTVLPYRSVQRNRNPGGRETWRYEDIYKFFIHSPNSGRKYLVEVHAYPGHLYTVDFYAKVSNVNRYRLRTNQHAMGKLGGTVLDILARIVRADPAARFGFLARPAPGRARGSEGRQSPCLAARKHRIHLHWPQRRRLSHPQSGQRQGLHARLLAACLPQPLQSPAPPFPSRQDGVFLPHLCPRIYPPVLRMDFAAALVLENARARLRPLELADFEELQAVAAAPEIWRHTLAPAFTASDLRACLEAALAARAQGLRYPFAVEDRATGRLAGSTSYYNSSEAKQRPSIGYTWPGLDFQRTGLNRACKYLLLAHAFGPLNCERVEWETDAQNLRLREAMRRLGATEEGTLRSHRRTQGGRRRNTVVFSIIKPGWPALRQSVFRQFGAGSHD